ncbi:Uncharacterised protein [Streptococcus pneumoniae]|nr:Uncharacterised protein [Streptococcus pneumoniae]CAG5361543.1 Uncharacterised protein [Streptococcus pneumoniae]CAG5616844.1 Uncharacterised protein [Streptococcus pneumoniae]CIV76481.1 Uncharacterised protein [Streptococcus pneumoniae]CIV89229.1 Uncharacterised protein [Streptococcus pneumoniae]
MTKRTEIPDKIPKPVPPKTLRTKGTTTCKPINPYTTEGIPTRSSIAGCKIFAPFGDTSVIKTAAPIAKGVAIRAERMVTIKEPKIIGRAPNSLLEGFQVPPKRKSKIFTPLTKKVDKPFCATKTKIMATRMTIKERQAKVKPFPNFSRREFFDGSNIFLANSS